MNELTLMVGLALIGLPGKPVERMTLIDPMPTTRQLCEATATKREADFKQEMRRRFPGIHTVEIVNTCAALDDTRAARLASNINAIVGSR